MRKTTTLCLRSLNRLLLIFLIAPGTQVTRAQSYDFVQNEDDMVVMEAENYTNNIPNGACEWLDTQEPEGYSGNGAMLAATPSSWATGEEALASSGVMSYSVNFTKTGTYYIYSRASATSGSDDSFHVGIDGTIPESGTYVNWEQSLGAKDGTWAWILWTNGKAGPQCSVDVTSEGVHDIEVYIREAGFKIDKLVLTPLAMEEYVPDSIGPPETKVGTGIIAAKVDPDVMSVYPNPVRDQLEVFIHDGAGSQAGLEILDITGKVYRRVEADFRRSLRIDISDLNAGVYFIKLNRGGKTASVKKVLKY